MGKQRKGNAGVAVGYIRVSTREQSLGPEAQRAALAAYAEREGVRLVAVFEDAGVSGTTRFEDRPGLVEAFRALREHGAGILLVAKRDRLARDRVEMGFLERVALVDFGARVLSADGGNGDALPDRASRLAQDFMSEVERERIAERTRAALRVKRDRGELVGSVPVGFRLAPDGVHLLPDVAESGAVARIVALRGQGFTLSGIAATLNRERVPARGARWYPMTVSRVLQRRAEGGSRVAVA